MDILRKTMIFVAGGVMMLVLLSACNFFIVVGRTPAQAKKTQSHKDIRIGDNSMEHPV